jgi:hypothetical protein
MCIFLNFIIVVIVINIIIISFFITKSERSFDFGDLVVENMITSR